MRIFGYLLILITIYNLGEIGRKVDLSKIQALKPAILNSFAHSTEEVKSAASYALGNIALGNLQVLE
jgi:cullin-associated NEDD8-dissociated protein 1